MAMTIHGRGFGLDEIECIQQQVLGYRDSFARGDFPNGLTTIVIVERDPKRLQVIEQVVSECFTKDHVLPLDALPAAERSSEVRSYSFPQQSARIEGLHELGKAKIFVAMPFSKDMRDVWTFGIQQPVRNLGLLCERLDEESFIGDILGQITRRIESASIV